MANSRENKKMYKKGKVITTWPSYVQNLHNHNNANIRRNLNEIETSLLGGQKMCRYEQGQEGEKQLKLFYGRK